MNQPEERKATAITTGESVKGSEGESVVKVTRIESSGDNLKFIGADDHYLVVSKDYTFSRLNSQVWS